MTEPVIFDCKILELSFLNQDQPNFVWIKSSAQQDTFIAKYENGSVSVLKIKESGNVLNFVLDPDLCCVYWDNEESSQQSQKLIAQTSSNDIVVYTVTEDGVTLHQSISYSKIKNSVKDHISDGKELQLVGSDRGYLFLWDGCDKLLCVKIALEGYVDLRYPIHLPQPTCVKTVDTECRSFQIVNGTVVIFDYSAFILYTESILDWRMSYDLSVIMIVFKGWTMLSVNILEYSKFEPESVAYLETSGQQTYNMEYMSYYLCRYGDLTWKREVVEHHMHTSGSSDSDRIVGFNISKKKSKECSTSARDTESLLFKKSLVILDADQWKLKTMEASNDILTLVLSKPAYSLGSDCLQAVCFANFKNQSVQLHEIGYKASIILSERPTCSHILLLDKYLKFISPIDGLQKDELISWMMSYCGPSGTDSLCQANQWIRTSVPLHAIEASLQQRQLDTLAFYLKSKQDLFSLTLHHNMGFGLGGEMRQIQDVLKLVTSTILASQHEPQAKIFVERLLSITVEFLYGLLEDARQNVAFGDKAIEIQKASECLMSYIPALRKAMVTLQYKRLQNSSSSLILESVKEKSLNTETNKLTTIEILVKENKVSHLQACLMSQLENSHLHFRDLISDLLKMVKKYLEKNDISSCQQILHNMGCNVTSVLWSMIQYNSCRAHQNFFTEQLSAAAALNPYQRQTIQYLDHLYLAYPSESFTLTVEIRAGNQIRAWSDTKDPLSKEIKAKSVEILSHCGEISSFTSHDTSMLRKDLYVALNFSWVSQWSTEMRNAVLIDAKFINLENDIILTLKNDPCSSLQFIMRHNLIDVLLPLMGENFPWPADPTQYLNLGWSHFQKETARQLLRLKKLNLEGLSSQNLDVLELLSAVGGPIQKPHPLQYAGQTFLRQHHIDVITQFVSAGLQLPFWMYCTVHSINPSELCINHSGSWFPLFQAFYSIPNHPTDKSVILSASLLAAADLLSFSPGKITFEMMLEKNQSMAAVGTLSYMTEEIPKLTAASVKKYFHMYPQLMSALISDGNESCSKYNTSVYQLLMGTSSFDLRRLFGWQSTNIFAGEDSPKVMPHFSEPRLTALRTRYQKLSFPYFLKHGRPVYAFLSFLSEELDRGEAPLSLKRIHQACGAALWIACQNFNIPSITSACVVFVELLGQDSAHIRTMLNVGRILLTHKHKCVGGSVDSRQEQLKSVVSDIVSDLLACVRSSHRYGNKLVKSLEAAIEEEIKLEVIGRCSYEAAHKWMIVLMLCEQLSLPLSTCFLRTCADTDNWLMFIWFSQLHQYPTHQLQNLLQSFRSPNLRDHLHYVINNADNKWFSTSTASSSNNRQVPNEKKSSVTQRSFLYSKIGLQKTRDRASTSSEEEDEKVGKISSFSSRLKQSEFNDCEMQESTAPDDVFRMLFYCESMPSRWRCLLSAAIALRNPLFAELAACCDCPVVPSICGWLLATLSPDAKQTFLSKHGHNVSKWNTDHLLALFDAVLLQGLEDSLATAFIILQPHSPLLPFFCFITEFVKRQNYTASKTYIDQFKEAMATFDIRKSNERTSDNDLPTIGDRLWFEKVAFQVLRHELKTANSLYQAKHLLEILDKKNMCLVFSFDVLDFSLLSKIVKILHANSVPCPQLGALLVSGTKSERFLSECGESVNYLISCGKFSEAHELARLAGISREAVTISQLKEEKDRLVSCGMWTARYVRIEYWSKCKTLMLQTDCSVGTCGHFYQTELQGTSVEFEKALLCQHWLTLLAVKSEPEVAFIHETVFRKMWRHRIAAKMSLEEQEPLDHIFDTVDVSSKKHGDLKTDLVQLCVLDHCVSDIQGDLNAQELEVLDSIMGNYLDDGRITDCMHVAAVFGHYNQDLAIIQTCIALALGQSNADNIEPAMRRLVVKSSAPRSRHVSLTLNRSFSMSSISSGTSTLTDASTLYDASDIISVMEKLYSHCVKGSQICLRVITCYKISQVLGVDYKQTVISSEFESLRHLLKVDYPSKFLLARDFLATSGLSEDDIAGFLADSTVNILKTLIQKETTSLTDFGSSSSDKTFDPADGMEVFSQFLKLTENTALLGNYILQSVATLLTSEHDEMASAVLTIQTELIIMAHECYTISSNMEGISHVLRAARVCCDCLAAAYEYNLMEDKLKVAILDYLKRYQPDDSEAYTMVALKFTMYRDIAAMLETCGHKSMNHFKDKVLDNSKETQESLKKCLQYFQDAAESYVKANSIRKAQHCVKMARLISLQLQFLPNGIQVVELSKEQVANFVNTHNRFIEAMVVNHAYERRDDWVEAVYNNVVLNGDLRYLQEIKLHVHITPALVEDVVKRHKQSPTKSTSALQSIKKLLSLCKDVHLQYHLAAELGLGDIVTSLLKGDTGSFLQDVTSV
ncbi:hypothetical protein Btru_060150 [Bulinus truncatus]|nr:hypothetical protein Btru_060150 [Bulinus truncatus]